MEVKKTDKANLEKSRGVFLQIGYVVALGAVLLAFEWTSKPADLGDLGKLDNMDLEEEIIPITRQLNEPPPPPPPVQNTEVINIVQDNVEINDELILDDTESDEATQVEIVEFAEEEETVEEQEIFLVVEDMPTFQGQNKDAFRIYIQQNLKYPVIAQENGISGRVFVSFVVDRDGSISNVQVVRGVDPALDKEAVRVIKSSPKWEPGKQRGRAVRVSFTFPIVFQLQ
ncbi:MAG: energy transducer TonB [Bacteroidetes bacterium GWC2_33_15]|nr:MAG: energy transducer TonB [Bacteroidetes bacterium GWA2_33_15]OFX52574.1 MAG: energy transducer TonB [Bacteroidetes bacterium GWC2_33_15]OFX63919.1 MAG: energy transducer TonB [Bacteroidetes bacterium GWB2_32_14]OFX70814.1 MAG: energy transducer TonB [Bacteroidetes bacterium GWD2_33_33]HAN19942.1 energy transducer TonB [Bacteroidales bacterium]